MTTHSFSASRLGGALLLLACLLALAAGCEKEGNPILKNGGDLAAYIRAQTPTALPPITQTGANTMGAYVHTDTGRVLFVASGIERPDPIGGESTDCPGWQNARFDAEIAILGRWCPRPEIGDSRTMLLGMNFLNNQEIIAYFRYQPGVAGKIVKTYLSKKKTVATSNVLNNAIKQTISGSFTGTLYYDKNPSDSILITDGRFDMSY